jgi:hypothetical protein
MVAALLDNAFRWGLSVMLPYFSIYNEYVNHENKRVEHNKEKDVSLGQYVQKVSILREICEFITQSGDNTTDMLNVHL